MWENLIKFMVEDGVDSDHVPVCAFLSDLELEGERTENIAKCKTKAREEKQIISWSEEVIAEFKEKTEKMEEEDKEEDSVETRWERIKKAINEAFKK